MNSSSSNRNDGNTIRITHGDAMSPDVDAFLNRQRSLKGESGIKKGRRAWYYQNWFVYMIMGALGALAAWLLLDPVYSDNVYIQAAIQEIHLEDQNAPEFVIDDQSISIANRNSGWIMVQGEKVWLLEPMPTKSGEPPYLDSQRLEVGQEVGLDIEYYADFGVELPIAIAIELAPDPQPADAQRLSIQERYIRNETIGTFIFGIIGAFIGLFIGAADGILCRMFKRAIVAGSIGFVVGLIGGFLSSIVANIVYSPLNDIALSNSADTESGLSTIGLIVQMGGRGLSWALAGTAMGLGQGLALRSKRLFVYGLIGGILGGLIGGLLFDPIDFLVFDEVGTARFSRLIGFCMVGAAIGASIGIVELLARDAWMRMQKGPLAGKEFLMFKDTMKIGSSSKSDLYLFNDKLVEPHHATLRAVGEHCEIETVARAQPIRVNNRIVERSRLRSGDVIEIGSTVFVFESKQ